MPSDSSPATGELSDAPKDATGLLFPDEQPTKNIAVRIIVMTVPLYIVNIILMTSKNDLRKNRLICENTSMGLSESGVKRFFSK
jgi:hypothetical protein